MKTTRMLTILVLALGLMVCQAKVSEAGPMGTAWTYQGRLIDANNAADGLYDFEFKLYDDPCTGTQQGSTININELDVIDGYFTVELDFGSDVFDGNAVWLEIGVRAGELSDPNVYTTLSPRLEVGPTPYALQTRGIFVDDSGNVGIGTTEPTEELEVAGTVKADAFLGDGSQLVGVQRKHTGAIYRWNTFRIWGGGQYAMNNNASMFGGRPPSSWTNGARAYQMSSDKEVLRTLYTRKGYGGKNAMVLCEHANQYYNPTDAKFATVLFRIKNTTAGPINWTPYFYYTANGSYGDWASATLNGANSWSYGGNMGLSTGSANITLSIPPNRTSTVIFVSSAYYWTGYGTVWFRDIQLGFFNDCLELPAGLEFVDDLDTAIGGWDQ